jgi:hypothetical protein
MSSLSGFPLEFQMYLACALFVFFAGLAIFRAVRNWVEESQEDKLTPVKLSSSQSIFRSMNPARWRGRYRCAAGQAYVRQAYPSLGNFVVTFSLQRGAFGIREPFGTHQVHYDVIWYQYEVNGVTLWGKFQFPFGVDTPEQATAIAQAMIGKTIPIQ